MSRQRATNEALKAWMASRPESEQQGVALKMVPTRFVQKYTRRVAHRERGGVNRDFAVEDDVLPLDRADMTSRSGSNGKSGAAASREISRACQ